MANKISTCRICGEKNLSLVIDLGEQYLTGIFPKQTEDNLTKGPLRLVKCHGENSCGLLQLEHSYDSEEMYGQNYGYRSGLNPSMIKHLKDKVTKIQKVVALKPDDLVIDIGSNDGTTLSAYPNHLLLVGIDPTGEKFIDYYPPHVQLIADFFSASKVKNLIPGKQAKVVTSFSMFYDLEDPVQFSSEIASILDPVDGIWVFEQSYMPLMLERNSYDTICHEHLEYYGLSQVSWILDKVGMKIIDVELNDINGGSFSVMAALKSSHKISNDAYIEELIEQEKQSGLSELAAYEAFNARARQSKNALKEFIADAISKGYSVAGIGASTKGNVLLQYCELTTQEISCIGDVNPDKFNSFTPGTNIPIIDENIVLKNCPDYLIVLPWHFKNFFLGNPLYKGKTLVFPLPTLEIVKVT